MISSAAGHRVRTSAPPAKELACLVLEAAYGLKWKESLANLSLSGLLSKTSLVEPQSGLIKLEQTWNGKATKAYRSRLRRLIAEHGIGERECSLLPTALAKNRKRSRPGGHGGKCLREMLPTLRAVEVRLLPTLTTKGNYNRSGASQRSGNGLATVVSGPLNPTWLEWFMGFPKGHTESVRLETPLSHSALKSSVKSSTTLMEHMQAEIPTTITSADGSEHAIIAPSALSRTMVCSAALIPVEDYKEKPSPHADEGTDFHKWLERGLKEGGRVLGKCEDDEMRKHVLKLVEITKKIKTAVGSDSIFRELIEQRVHFTKYLHGSIDWGLLYVKDGRKKAFIIDGKYGKGVAVPAPGNPQLAAYLEAALREHEWPAVEATLAIYQPRNQEHTDKALDQWSLDKKEIRTWEVKLTRFERTALNVLAGKTKPKAVAGDHCQFCKRKPICPAFKKLASTGGILALETAAPLPAVVITSETTPPSFNLPQVKQLSDKQLSAILKNADVVRSFLKAVEKHIAARQLSNAPLKGWKLVEGRKSRQWIDDERRIGRFFNKKGLDPYVRSLVGIGKAEEMLGRKLPSELTTFTTPKPKLVEKNDPRPALKNASIEMLDSLGDE